MSEARLLGCPWCGAMAVMDLESNNAYIACSERCRMDPMINFVRDHPHGMADAIAAWNRRAPPQDPTWYWKDMQAGVKANNGEDGAPPVAAEGVG